MTDFSEVQNLISKKLLLFLNSSDNTTPNNKWVCKNKKLFKNVFIWCLNMEYLKYLSEIHYFCAVTFDLSFRVVKNFWPHP